MYNTNYDVLENLENLTTLNNKLFCTFTNYQDLDDLIDNISVTYSIVYNKLFVLEIPDKEEYVVTYNIEHANMDYILPNTILVHRKKESNTLYTINALNELIKKLNNGYLDKRYKINWKDYQNSILLTQQNSLNQLPTKIFRIINL